MNKAIEACQAISRKTQKAKQSAMQLKEGFWSKYESFLFLGHRLKLLPKYVAFYRNKGSFEALTDVNNLVGWSSGNGGYLWVKHEHILGDNPNYLHYLIRRFGYPVYGSDDYKEVMNYTITTPLDDVKLDISVKGLMLSFGHCFNPELEKMMGKEYMYQISHDKPLPLPFTYTHLAKLAIEEALKDLLKPVEVRDVYININGRVGDDYFADAIYNSGDELISPKVASPSPSAGIGLGCMAVLMQSKEGQELWFRLGENIRELGDGDFELGVNKACELIERGIG